MIYQSSRQSHHADERIRRLPMAADDREPILPAWAWALAGVVVVLFIVRASLAL